MKQFVETVVRGLVDDPEAVEVIEHQEGSSLHYEIRVAENDRGNVIGLPKQIDDLRARKQSAGSGDLFESARELSGIPGAKAIAGRVEDVDAKAMRTMVDDLRNRLGTGVVCLAAAAGDKALLAIGVTKDLTDRLKAGDLIREVAGVVGGGGGGRPDFAQAGGKDPARIDEAIARFNELVGD